MKFENINELLVTLLLWITTNTEFKDLNFKPNIEFISQQELSDLVCEKPCEILAYTPNEPKNKIFLVNTLEPLSNVCDRGILLHELIHVFQKYAGKFENYEERTRKHMREMQALVNHNRFLSEYGKKILYSNGFAGKFKSNTNNNLYC